MHSASHPVPGPSSPVPFFMRILFWGTPDFATPPLRALLGEGHDVVGVVTQPDRPQGRSRSVLVPSPVKVIALEEGLPVLQPEKPRGDAFMEEVRSLAPDLSVVVAYGHILPKAVIDLPAQGTLNIHASILPKLRGAAPIQAAIRLGLGETGVTIMRMVPALDAGPIVHVLRTPIPDDETYGELQLRLSELGAEALVEALVLMANGTAPEIPQDDTQATFAPKVERDDARVEWTRPAIEVARLVRAYDPRPGAWTTKSGLEVKLFGARVVDGSSDGALAGTVAAMDGNGIVVASDSGLVRIADVQPAGKKRVKAVEWVRGRGVSVGEVLGS
jgi:methionyl-tRNA formyltransferase